MTDDARAFYSKLESEELTQISFSQYIVHFRFVSGVVISVESKFEHLGENEKTASRFEVYGTCKETTVLGLLGQKIVHAEPVDDDLLIRFAKGGSLKLFQDPTLRTSYEVYLQGSFHSM